MYNVVGRVQQDLPLIGITIKTQGTCCMLRARVLSAAKDPEVRTGQEHPRPPARFGTATPGAKATQRHFRQGRGNADLLASFLFALLLPLQPALLRPELVP